MVRVRAASYSFLRSPTIPNTCCPPLAEEPTRCSRDCCERPTWVRRRRHGTCKRGHLPRTPVRPPMVQSSPASAPAAGVAVDMDDAQKVLEEMRPTKDSS
uniref:Uncharacterized protein n=1 Tax=Setaria viridis TaxID=4556 RepID=A0A4U6T0K4_SETVI|nr:hypothetical protein SEVIR_9G331650v2 [Setaria viridis]